MRVVAGELSAVNADIKALSRKVGKRSDAILRGDDLHQYPSSQWDHDSFPESGEDAGILTPGAEIDGIPSDASAPGLMNEYDSEGIGTLSDLDGMEQAGAGWSGGRAGAYQDRRGMQMAPRTDERFASYFMAGSLQEAEPLRGERHTQRNKAIFLLVFLFLLVVLYFTMFR